MAWSRTQAFRLLPLEQPLETVDRIAAANDLPDAIITELDLKITLVDAAVPDATQALVGQTVILLHLIADGHVVLVLHQANVRQTELLPPGKVRQASDPRPFRSFEQRPSVRVNVRNQEHLNKAGPGQFPPFVTVSFGATNLAAASPCAKSPK